VLEFDHDGGFDLRHFGFDEERVGVAFGVVFYEDGEGFVVAVFGDEVARGFGEEAEMLV
jgi:hypothetical protein